MERQAFQDDQNPDDIAPIIGLYPSLHKAVAISMSDNQEMTTKLLIVDDHPLVVLGWRFLFASESSVKIEGAKDAKTGYMAFVEQQPDVAVVEIELPDVSGFELLRQIRKKDPDAGIIMFSENNNPSFVLRALQMGALGYLSKSDDPRLFAQAVCKVAAGDKFISPSLAESVTFFAGTVTGASSSQITPRELEVLRLLRRGHKLAEIADALGISYKTIANTKSSLARKLGAKSQSDLIRIAVEMNLGSTQLAEDRTPPFHAKYSSER